MKNLKLIVLINLPSFFLTVEVSLYIVKTTLTLTCMHVEMQLLMVKLKSVSEFTGASDQGLSPFSVA